MPAIAYQGDNLILSLYIQPGAKHTELIGYHGEALKIRLQASPVAGRANTALVRYLAHLFQVPQRHVVLQKGGQSRYKKVVISGCKLSTEEISAFIKISC